MATYTFETMAQSDASNFTATDFLFFLSGNVANLGVTDTPGTSSSNALGTTITAETITLTSGGKSLSFSAAELSAASKASPDHILIGNDLLVFGQGGTASSPYNDAGTAGTLSLAAGTAGHAAVAFGFAGDDSIVGGAANDTINGGEGNDTITGHSSAGATESDWLLGGNGNDSITSGAGNDHIFGNVAVGASGTADGNDVIVAGDGHDYVNGNAGNDTIDGGNGNDRLYGGNGDDSIEGGAGNDYLQGNKGNDTLQDTGTSATEVNVIHGGAGNDIISAAHGLNQLFGELGNDSITGGNEADKIWGGAGYDTLAGGNGADTFNFASGDADIANVTTAYTATSHGVTDVVWDFTHATDKLSLGFSVTAVDTAAGGTTFATIDDAYTYAKGVLAGHGTEVAALYVNDTTTGHTADVGTYLFWDSAHSTGTIDSTVLLHGVTDPTTIAKTDFV
jgi:Ca2+-binding RTX toxin-like protein